MADEDTRATNGSDRDQKDSDTKFVQSKSAYIAFAFAAADLLLETDESGRVVFAVGAAMSLVGRPARLLSQMTLHELFKPSDRLRISKAFSRMAAGTRVRHLLLQVQFPNGNEVPVALCGYAHPEQQGRFLLVLTHSGTLRTPKLRKERNGLLNRESFEAVAETILSEASGETGEDYRLTLLDLPEIADLRSRVGVEATANFVNAFSDYLRGCSVGGEAAAKLGDSRYGLIHGPDISTEDIQTTLVELAKSLIDPKEELNPGVASLSLDTGSISSEEATRALIYTVNRFTSDGRGTIQELAKGAASARLSVTVTKMQEVKKVISSGNFDIYFQPIVDLWNNAVHHFECLLRFRDSDESPYTTVTFAEDVGIVGELDIAVFTRVIEIMRSGLGADKALKFSVNISGRSLTEVGTAARLMQIIHKAHDLRGRLMFELTESAELGDLISANAIIQEIRARGFLVGLDDFGAGAAAFHYLRALAVDHVKIDGSYVRQVTNEPENLPFVRAITQLCRELKIATIAEHIEDRETANLLRTFNVRYGQG